MTIEDIIERLFAEKSLEDLDKLREEVDELMGKLL